MKSKFLVLMTAVLLTCAGYVWAHEGMDHDEAMESMDHDDGSMMMDQGMMDEGMMAEDTTAAETKAIEVGNKICPVSGNPVDDDTMGEAVQYVYNGKIYNLCCAMCAKDFKKNPEKYSKIAEDEVAKEKMMQENQEGQKDIQK